MTFDEWWKEGTSVKVPLYGEANAKKAWDHQQAKLDIIREEMKRSVASFDADNVIAYAYEAVELMEGLLDDQR